MFYPRAEQAPLSHYSFSQKLIGLEFLLRQSDNNLEDTCDETDTQGDEGFEDQTVGDFTDADLSLSCNIQG